MSYEFVAGDTGSKLRVTCKNSSDLTAIDLTGAVVALKWRSSVSDAIVTKTMTLLSPNTDGKAEYQFGTSELEKGPMSFEVQITDAGGKVVRSLDLISETVREALV